VPEQFVAVTIVNPRVGRRREPEMILLRFDREQDLELVRTKGVSEAPALDRAIGVVSPSTARRMVAGRTAIVRDRTDAAEVETAFGAMGDIGIVSLSELFEVFFPNGDHDDLVALDDPVDKLRSLASGVREVFARIAEYDTVTLARASGLATAASWPVSGLLRDDVELRNARPIMLRPEYRFGSHELSFLTSRDRPEPLKRTGDTDPVSTESVEAMLGPGGGFSRVMLAFEQRKAQQRMAAVVTGALNDDGWLLVEAGTGTGKSVAYLAPAARFALQRGERVVVSTNTKALQDQLILKDVPDLQRALAAQGSDDKLKAVVLKGRSNYLCLRRWFAHEKQPVLGPSDAGLRAKVNVWLPQTSGGDRAELRLTADEEHEFSRVSAEGEACNASKCVYQQRNQCFLFRARRNAENAHLVVVNHALLLSDSGGEGSILPEYERLVIDEAHHLEDQATSQFGMTIQELSLPELVDTFLRMDGPVVAGLLPEAAAMLGRTAFDERAQTRAAEARDRLQTSQAISTRVRTASLDLFSRIRSLCESAGTQDTGYGRTLRITPAIRRSPAWADIEVAFDQLNSQLIEFEDLLRWYLAALHEQHPDELEENEAQDPFEDLEIEFGAGIERGLELSANLSDMILSPSVGRVYWVSISPGVNRLSLNAAPLHVGDMLRASLFERMRTVVMTSATLTTDDNFAYVKDRLSFEEAEEVTLESPFDYRSSALLYLVDDIPEPNQPRYQPMLEQAIVELGTAIEGRTLVLFTSHSALRATYRAIKQPLADAGINVLAQRADGSPRQLIEQFKSTSRTMLLGTSTFWEGVDVVGDALSALVIAKLPFAVPSDPVVAARSEQFEDPFRQYSIPQAVLRFKQGFGRLIRATSDRGICVVLDRRTISKRYGASFVQSLPHCTVRVGSSADIADASVEWLDSGNVIQMPRGRTR
jgi:predicted DnaQ family exonuclease/DinG family helicase